MTWLTSLNDDTRELFAADSDTAALPTLGCQTCPPSPVTLVLVEFTDQFDATEVFSGERSQFVNLSARALMDHDRAITSRNQLRRSPPFIIRVSPPQAAAVRVRLVREEAPHEFPGASRNLSTRERGLSHLQYARSVRTMHTNAEGELLVQPGLPIAAQAGYRYHVEAAVAGGSAIRSSNAVAVRRRIYMLPVVLYRPGRGAAVAAMARIRRHLRSLGIDLVVLPAQTGTARGVTSESTFAAYSTIGTNALERPAWISSKRPHCIAVVVGEFTGTTGVIEEIDFERVMRREADGQFDAIPDIQLRHGGDTYNVVPLTDRSQLIRATAKFPGEAPRTIPPEDVLAIDNFATTIALDLRTVPLAASTADSMTLRVRLKVTRFWYVGWAFGGAPVIYLNMRDPNSDGVLESREAAPLLLHEMGHKMGLASDGSGQLPDQQAHHYGSFDSHGRRHTGPHCSTGVAAGTDLWTDAALQAASCNMWGQLKPILSYCPECKTTLRKVDLSNGF